MDYNISYGSSAASSKLFWVNLRTFINKYKI